MSIHTCREIVKTESCCSVATNSPKNTSRIPLVKKAKLDSNVNRLSLHNDSKLLSGKELSWCQCNRKKLYDLQDGARSLFTNEGKKLEYKYPQNFHRTAQCLRNRLGHSVSVLKSKQHKKSFFSNLVQCGSVWSCPVCANKIQSLRQIEVKKGMEWAYSSGFKCIMFTFTFPHDRSQSCKEVADNLRDAHKYLKTGGGWQKLKKFIGFEGLIRGQEVTYGENGWHPHTHEIWIVDGSCDAEEVRRQVYSRWEKACLRKGVIDQEKIDDFRQYSLDMIDNANTSDYIAKMGYEYQLDTEQKKHWGAEKELVRSSMKGSRSGKTPFQLLEAYLDGDRRSGDLFVEFSMVYKGKAQLFWTRGLKAKVGIKDKNDDELVNEKEDIADVVETFGAEEWKAICLSGSRGLILNMAENNPLAIKVFVSNLTRSIVLRE